LKTILLLPPVLSLLVVVGWVGNERRSIASLEQESAVLRKHLASRSSGFAATDNFSNPEKPDKLAKYNEPIDWRSLADQISKMEKDGGMGEIRTMIRLQQRIQALSTQELISALDEIGGMDLPDESRLKLEQMLIGPLCQKDPELALNRSIDRIGDDRGGMSWQLSNAMKEWAKKDLGKATSWFDRQIADGKFDSKSLDGKNRSRMNFEGMLIGAIIGTNLAAAEARLQSLPQDQRGEVLRNYAGNAGQEEDQLAFANLVRSQLSAKEQAKTLAQQASQMAWSEGYTKITEYLDRIEATPSERSVCVIEAADSKIQQLANKGKIGREDIDTLREWATQQSPEAVEMATGKALVKATQGYQKMDFSEAADLAIHYHATSGNDDVLIGFLEGGSVQKYPDKAIELAGKISDPAKREEVLNRFK
jgi:gas vesicle protein